MGLIHAFAGMTEPNDLFIVETLPYMYFLRKHETNSNDQKLQCSKQP